MRKAYKIIKERLYPLILPYFRVTVGSVFFIKDFIESIKVAIVILLAVIGLLVYLFFQALWLSRRSIVSGASGRRYTEYRIGYGIFCIFRLFLKCRKGQ